MYVRTCGYVQLCEQLCEQRYHARYELREGSNGRPAITWSKLHELDKLTNWHSAMWHKKRREMAEQHQDEHSPGRREVEAKFQEWDDYRIKGRFRNVKAIYDPDDIQSNSNKNAYDFLSNSVDAEKSMYLQRSNHVLLDFSEDWEANEKRGGAIAPVDGAENACCCTIG